MAGGSYGSMDNAVPAVDPTFAQFGPRHAYRSPPVLVARPIQTVASTAGVAAAGPEGSAYASGPVGTRPERLGSWRKDRRDAPCGA